MRVFVFAQSALAGSSVMIGSGEAGCGQVSELLEGGRSEGGSSIGLEVLLYRVEDLPERRGWSQFKGK